MIVAGLVDQVQLVADAADADRLPLLDPTRQRRRKHPADAASAPTASAAGCCRQRFEIDRQDVRAAQPVEQRRGPRRATCASCRGRVMRVTVSASDASTRRRLVIDRANAGDERDRGATRAAAIGAPATARLRAGLDVRAAESLVRGAATGSCAPPPRALASAALATCQSSRRPA